MKKNEFTTIGLKVTPEEAEKIKVLAAQFTLEMGVPHDVSSMMREMINTTAARYGAAVFAVTTKRTEWNKRVGQEANRQK